MRKQNSSPPKRACRSLAVSRADGRSCARRSSDRTCSRSSAATRSMIRSPTAWPSASLYHLNPVISTRPTAHQRPRCSSARNDSSCSVKPREVHQLRLRVAVRLVGEVGDQRFEVARDAADGRVLRRELGSDARHLVGEARRQRLDGFLLRLLPEPLVPGEHGVDGGEQRRLDVRRQVEVLAHPSLEVAPGFGQRPGGNHWFPSHDCDTALTKVVPEKCIGIRRPFGASLKNPNGGMSQPAVRSSILAVVRLPHARVPVISSLNLLVG